MEAPTDIGEPQAEFEDAVCRKFESDGSPYEVLDRNMYNDPFEPDITFMDSDEWVFHLICYYIEDLPSDGMAVLYPKTFGMRKWIADNEDEPTYLALGVGGTPQNPELLYFSRFFNFPDQSVDLKSKAEYRINLFRLDFFDDVIKKDFERMYSPS